MRYLKNALLIAAAVFLLGGIGWTSLSKSPSPLQPPAPPRSPMMAQAQGIPGLSLGVGTYNIDEHGRIPYQSTQSKSGTGCTGNECFFEFGFVPQGHRIVITRISGLNSFNGTPTQVIILANNGSGVPVATFLAPAPNLTAVYDHQTEIFYDAGQLLEIQVQPFPTPFFTPAAQQVTISGYELNCTTAPCSAIAH